MRVAVGGVRHIGLGFGRWRARWPLMTAFGEAREVA